MYYVMDPSSGRIHKSVRTGKAALKLAQALADKRGEKVEVREAAGGYSEYWDSVRPKQSNPSASQIGQWIKAKAIRVRTVGRRKVIDILTTGDKALHSITESRGSQGGLKNPSGKDIPKGQIKFIVDRMHVGESDEAVAENIRHRTEGRPEWTPGKVRQAVAYAVKYHHANQKLYRAYSF